MNDKNSDEEGKRFRLPGEWREANDEALIELLGDHGIVGLKASRLLDDMAAAGVIVRKGYYVPSDDDLFAIYRTIGYYLYKGMAQSGIRWVMCRETHNALAAKYQNKVAPAPMRFDAAFWASTEGQELPTSALEMDVLQVMRARRSWTDHGMLFGVPIRIDPAARTPLLEVEPS